MKRNKVIVNEPIEISTKKMLTLIRYEGVESVINNIRIGRYKILDKESNTTDYNMGRRKKECVLTLKTGDHKWTLKAYQSPRGIRHEGKRPNFVMIDCYQEFNQNQLFKLIQYLETIACAMENNNS